MMKKYFAIGIMLCLCIYGCSPRIQSQSFHSKDSTSTVRDTDLTVPERADNFDVDLTPICDEIARQNDSLVRANDSLVSRPSLVVKNNSGGSVSFQVKPSGKVNVECHEDEWKQKFEGAIRESRVVIRDSSIVYRDRCDSSFHRFTVRWFWGSIALMVIALAVMVWGSKMKGWLGL